ncbi:hypothetical protein AAVH_10854 [Aphelenchoides avenae]|nr:hypothetical protein AAVH_10854 [Aphelenchus avenae]
MTRPTTAFVDENVTQMDAHACGSDGNLSGHQSHLTTDRSSTPAEAPWYDRANATNGSGSGEKNAIPDVEWNVYHRTRKLRYQTRRDTALMRRRNLLQKPYYQDFPGYAVSTASPADNEAVLLECLRTTAAIINNGISRPAIVFFDSGSNTSYIAMKLALELQLPCLENRPLRVHTFGTDKITMIDGFDATILPRSPQGAQVSLVATASARIVPPVTTALLEPEEVAQLRRNECSLISTRETPYLLIGQDLVHLFGRKLDPSCRTVSTSSGAGKVAYRRKAADSTNVAAAPDSESQDAATETMDDTPSENDDAPSSPHSPAEKPPSAKNLGCNPDDPLNLWTLEDDDPAPSLAHSADSEAGPTTQSLAHTADSGRGMQAVTDASRLCAH